MIFGMSTACLFPKVYIEDAIGVIARMGVTHIEIFFSCLAEYKTDFVRELKKRADDHGVCVNSVHAFSLQFEPQLFSAHERARREALDTYTQVLEAAAMLGAGSYVFHGPANVKRSRKLALNFEYVAEKTQPLIELAKSHNVKLSWENVHWCWYCTPDFPKMLLEQLDDDSLWFTFDLKQAVQSGFAPADYLAGMHGHLSNVHICDVKYDNGAGYEPVLPFHGGVDFAEFRSALKKEGYDGAIMLEVYGSNYKDYRELFDNFKLVERFFGGAYLTADS